jgi:DNA helicase-2/ATP-dependent DNA helicase PcrA
MDLFEGLTEPQRQAAGHVDGPLLVLAGAGSGKTRVITRRAAHLARTACAPHEILAITFTNKAAGEMRERIDRLGVGRGMWVCTFHAFCARVLREFGSHVGLTPAFTIFDESDRRSVIREALSRCDLSGDNWPPRVVDEAISRAKNRLLTVETYTARATDFSEKTIARVYAESERLLRAQNACDFDDLLLHVALMVQNNDEVREQLCERFRYLLIDEYQDTNEAQYVIASKLASSHRNICATGDPDQSIYAWRGANIQNILDFEKDYPDALVVRLEQNFRSTGLILSAASEVIGHNRGRKHKSLWTDTGPGEPVRLWSCENESMEAESIVADMKQAIEDGKSPGEIAVFYRTNSQTRVIEEALMRAGVAYQVARGVEFYGRKEIRDALAYLRMIVNPADEAAITRAIATPARGIGKTTLGRLKARAEQSGIALGDAILNCLREDGAARGAGKLRGFARLYAELRAIPQHPAAMAVEAVLAKSGLLAAIAEGEGIGGEAIENVRELVSAAHHFNTENPDGTLAEWLQQVSLLSDVDALADGLGAVTLMTLHAAKGLEFDLIYITGLEEGLLPHERAVGAGQADVEEERRLFFVGITRAKRRLTLSHAIYRTIRGSNQRRISSPFLRELPEEEIERRTFETERDRSKSHRGGENEPSHDPVFDELMPGQRVGHADYGEGEVLRIDKVGKTSYVRIHFRDFGERAFALEHTRLTIMDE